MTEEEFLALVRHNPVNAALLDRLPQLAAFAPGALLVAGSLFGTVWNVQVATTRRRTSRTTTSSTGTPTSATRPRTP